MRSKPFVEQEKSSAKLSFAPQRFVDLHLIMVSRLCGHGLQIKNLRILNRLLEPIQLVDWETI